MGVHGKSLRLIYGLQTSDRLVGEWMGLRGGVGGGGDEIKGNRRGVEGGCGWVKGWWVDEGEGNKWVWYGGLKLN